MIYSYLLTSIALTPCSTDLTQTQGFVLLFCAVNYNAMEFEVVVRFSDKMEKYLLPGQETNIMW